MQAAKQAQNLRLSTMQEMLSLLPRAKAASVSFLAAFSGSCTCQQRIMHPCRPETDTRLSQAGQPTSLLAGKTGMQEEASSCLLALCSHSQKGPFQTHCTLTRNVCSNKIMLKRPHQSCCGSTFRMRSFW